jgi:hypothetical protein
LYGTISGDLPTSSGASTSKGMKDGAMLFGAGPKKAAQTAEDKSKKATGAAQSAKGQSTLGRAVKKEPSPAPAASKGAEVSTVFSLRE